MSIKRMLNEELNKRNLSFSDGVALVDKEIKKREDILDRQKKISEEILKSQEKHFEVLESKLKERIAEVEKKEIEIAERQKMHENALKKHEKSLLDIVSPSRDFVFELQKSIKSYNDAVEVQKFPFGRDGIELTFNERMLESKKINFNDVVTMKTHIYTKIPGIKDVIDKLKTTDGAVGVVVRDAGMFYGSKDGVFGVSFLPEMNLKVLGITESDGKTVAELGLEDTDNNKITIASSKCVRSTKIGDIVRINFDSIEKDSTSVVPKYRVENPTIIKTDEQTATDIDFIEKVVFQSGFETTNFSDSMFEPMNMIIKEWPPLVVICLERCKEDNIKIPFVLQRHTTPNSANTHTDFKFFLPDLDAKVEKNSTIKFGDVGNVDGIVINIRMNTYGEDNEDCLDNDSTNILCSLKPPLSKDWIFYEGVSDLGTIKRYGYGFITMKDSTSDNIVLGFSSQGDSSMKHLDGDFEFTIGKMGDYNSIFFSRKIKQGKKSSSMSKETLNRIFEMTKSNKFSRSEISKEVGLSKTAIYNYQKKLGII